MKKCTICNELKVKTKFYKNKISKDGSSNQCKDCLKRNARKSRNFNPKTHIYIIHNKAWKGWVKVGRSTNPIKRLENYQTSCPNRDFEIAFSMLVEDAYPYEEYFRLNIKSKGYEWFHISIEEAILIMNKISSNENL